MDLLPLRDFISLYISHLENAGPLSYPDLSNVQWKAPMHTCEDESKKGSSCLSIIMKTVVTLQTTPKGSKGVPRSPETTQSSISSERSFHSEMLDFQFFLS